MSASKQDNVVGFIGLGVIGLPAATNLVKAGFSVVGFSLDNMESFADAGGLLAQSAADVAARCDVIIHCLPTAQALDTAVYGEQGILKQLRPGTVVIELSSYSLKDKQRLRDALSEANSNLLDCELTARAAGKSVAEKECIIFVGGDKQLADRFQPLLGAITHHSVYAGAFGSSLRLKTVNNLLVAVHILAAAEAISLAKKAGIDPSLVSSILPGGAGGSAALAHYGPRMVDGNFDKDLTGQIKVFDKYFDLVEELATVCNAQTPLLDLTRNYFRRAIAEGHSQRDVSAVICVYD